MREEDVYPTPEQVRGRYGWTQEYASRVFGVSERTWGSWEARGWFAQGPSRRLALALEDWAIRRRLCALIDEGELS